MLNDFNNIMQELYLS